MTEKLQQTIKEELAELPKETQEAVGVLDWVKIAEEIGRKYLLGEDEITDFQTETLLVLIGAVDPEFYAVNIENHAGATKDTANKMAKESFEKIFAPVAGKIEENIKKNLTGKNPNWEQTLNFILSGGNYAALIAPTRANSAPVFNQSGSEGRFFKNSPLPEYPAGGGGRISPSPLQGEGRGEVYPPQPDVHRVTPEEGNTPIPKKMTDIKSKFVI